MKNYDEDEFSSGKFRTPNINFIMRIASRLKESDKANRKKAQRRRRRNIGIYYAKGPHFIPTNRIKYHRKPNQDAWQKTGKGKEEKEKTKPSLTPPPEICEHFWKTEPKILLLTLRRQNSTTTIGALAH